MLPVYDFGDTAIRMVDYYNWLHPAASGCERPARNSDAALASSLTPEAKPYSFELLDVANITEHNNSLIGTFKMLGAASVPIGSVEFALAWFKAMGVDNVKPLNIPRELWHFCERKVAIGRGCDFNGTYMRKDIDIIKSDDNGQVRLFNDENDTKECFFTEWLDDVESEWRVFVFNGEIRDIRCYSGDFWRIPDRQYIERVVKEYDNPSYTLDVMVTPKRTEILELHDFFSCGLYGFDDPILPLMWKRAVRNVMEREKTIK